MGKFQYDGHVLHWKEYSQGEDTYIFINGYSATQYVWDSEIDCIRHLGRCLTVDLPGHYPAETKPDYKQLTVQNTIDMYTAFVQEVAPTGRVTLIGHSTGGLVTLLTAAHIPDRIDRIICVDAVVWGPLFGILGTAQWLIKNNLYSIFWMLWRFTQFSHHFMMFGLSFYTHRRLRHYSNEYAWELCKSAYDTYRHHELRNLGILLEMLREADIRTYIPQIKAQALVITGEHDTVVPAEQARWLADHLRQAELHVIADGGHIPHVEYHAQWLEIFTGWLERHP